MTITKTETKVTATFKGQNGSCGFVTGKEYTLHLNKITDGCISVYDVNGMNHYCEYTSFITFLNNWKNVSSILN